MVCNLQPVVGKLGKLVHRVFLYLPYLAGRLPFSESILQHLQVVIGIYTNLD